MLVDHLLAAGWNVRALVRSRSAQRLADKPGLEAVTGSLEDGESLGRLVQGAAAVVHCAGAVRGATAADFNAVNVAGLERLVRAALARSPRPSIPVTSVLCRRARPSFLTTLPVSARGDLPWPRRPQIWSGVRSAPPPFTGRGGRR